jgi:serine/threonine protein phosphatase PrpC
VIAEPDIVAFKIKNNHDYIFLACDGVFDKLSNKDVVHLIWQSII